MRSAMAAGKPRSVETRTMVELARMDGIGQAALVRRGEVSPVELVEAAEPRFARWPLPRCAVATQRSRCAPGWRAALARRAPVSGMCG